MGRGTVYLLALVTLAASSAGCRSTFVHANLSAPVVTGGADNETVWWAEHRANERGYNETRIIMCRQGMDPPCVRYPVRDVNVGR